MKHDYTHFTARAGAAVAYGNADTATLENRIRRFIPLVRKSAWHIYGSGRDGLEVEDLMQAGMVALTECARRHNGPDEDGFAAYAKLRVRGAMFDIIRKLLPDGRTMARRRKQVGDAREQLEKRLGRAPSDAELVSESAILEVDLPAYNTAPVHMVQLDSAYDDNNVAFADETPDAFELLSQIEDIEGLTDAMGDLPERLRLILQLYFVEELNLKEIAAVLEVSVPRVHQLKAQALSKLKDHLGSDPASHSNTL